LAPGKVQLPAQVSENEIGRALSQPLHDLGRVGQLRGPDQKMAVPLCGIKTYPMIWKPNSARRSFSVFVKCRLNRSESKMRARSRPARCSPSGNADDSGRNSAAAWATQTVYSPLLMGAYMKDNVWSARISLADLVG
jgi:hypothetical protein